MKLQAERSLKRQAWLCQVKVYHATEQLAQDAVTVMEREKNLNPGVVRAFKCTICDGWHLGGVIRARRKRERRRAARPL